MGSTQSSRKPRGQGPDLSMPNKGKEKKKNSKGGGQAGEWWRYKGEQQLWAMYLVEKLTGKGREMIKGSWVKEEGG